MARPSRRQAQRERRHVVGGLVAALVALAIIGAAAWFWQAGRDEGVDAVTLCPANGPTGHVVLLVDKTDPLTFTQNQAFAVTLRDLITRRTPPGTLLSVFVLGEDFKATAQPLIELCNPGTGAGRSALTSNPKQLERRYEDRFLAPLLKESEALVATTPSKTSPLFEMFQLVGINAFKAHDIHGGRRLVVMSDMLHNTPQFSMYKGPVDYATFARSDYAARVRAALPGVDVEIHLLMNTPQLQTRRNMKFWEDWFDHAGARIVAVQPMEG